MKKTLAILLAFACLAALCACSIPAKRPADGIFYCAELHMSIDFSKLNSDPNCVKIHLQGEDYAVGKCLIDYGNGITICSPDQTVEYLIGKFSYENDVFTVQSNHDDMVYTFERTQ